MNLFAPPPDDLYSRLILFFEKNTGRYFAMSDLMEEFNDVNELALTRELSRHVKHNHLDTHEDIVRSVKNVSSSKRVIKWTIKPEGINFAEKVRSRRPVVRLGVMAWGTIVGLGVLLTIALDLFDVRRIFVNRMNGVQDSVVIAPRPVTSLNEKVQKIIPNDTYYTPPHYRKVLANGDSSDADFDTGIGDPTAVEVRVAVTFSRDTVKASVFMKALELRWDSTCAQGWSPEQILYVNKDADFYISNVIPTTNSAYRGETSEKVSITRLFSDQRVRKFEIYIDKKGDEAGLYTRVDVYWDTLSIVTKRKVPIAMNDKL